VSFTKKLIRGLRRLVSRLPVDPRLAPLIKLRCNQLPLGKVDVPYGPLAGRVLAVQCVEDPIFHGLLACLAKDLSETVGVQPWLLQVRSINGAIGAGPMARLARSWPITALFNAQWRRAHTGVVASVAYRSGGWQSPLARCRGVYAGRALQQRLQQQGGLVDLRVEDILVGDLVIDSYLRFRPAATVDLADPFLAQLLTQMLRDVALAQAWFACARPVLYLSSYSTYIEHGVAVRVALARGVPVRVFGNLNTFGKRLSVDDPYHATNGCAYRTIAESLVNPGPALARAEELLSGRLGGQIDQAISYMRQSAYVHSDEPVPDISGAVVVYLHDFFDSPHIYADMVFDDFWQWVCCTIRTLSQAGIPFYLKPHPNQIAASVAVLDQLRGQFPALRLLSARITNRQLVKAGMGAGVTVYGTVGHELAFLGVPVICCARHPHHAFDFCRTARNVPEYLEMLRQPFKMPLSREEMRHQALQFYYAHNLHGDAGALVLRERFSTLFKTGLAADEAPDALANCLAAMRTEPAWSVFVSDLIQDMQAYQAGNYTF
jgi:hypothetical protein